MIIKKIICIFHYLVYLFCSKDVKQIIKEDISLYSKKSLADCLVSQKNFRNLFYFRINNRVFKKLLNIILRENPNIEISGEIGAGLVMHHRMGCTINAKKIGKNVHILQGVTIGKGKETKNGRIPVIGDDVWVCANAVIIGGVEIGNNVIVGAGAIVINDVPDNCVVAGVPARVIEKNIKTNIE